MIVGLHGRAGAGKDTVYGFMAKHHPGKVIRKAFADPLKISAARALGFDGPPEYLIEMMNRVKLEGTISTSWYEESPVSGNLLPRGHHISGREFLQRYGTEAHREVFGDNFWVDAALPRWDGMGQVEDTVFGTDHFNDYVVFTDVRFVNEAERIREWHGTIWEVVRDTGVEDGHASEQRLPDELIDGIFYNTGSLEDLERIVADTLEIRRNVANERG